MNDENKQQPDANQGEPDTIRQIKSAQTLITISTIAAPVSLLFGGVLLSSAAIVCGIVGMRKLGKIQAHGQQERNAIQVALKSARMAIVMSGIALALNAVSMMWFLESGGMSIIDGTTTTQTPEATPSSSIWG